MKQIKKNSVLFISLLLLCIGIGTLSFSFIEKTPEKPRVSIITSVYKGDPFIEGFMEDITKQTIFDQCELIMINADSPGNEEPIIKKYMEKHPNIVYVKLDKDPGIYAVWNRAIQLAKSDFISNANLDDRSRKDSLEVMSKELQNNPDVDLIYSDFITTTVPNENMDFYHCSSITNAPQFSLEQMRFCLPGPRPLWRKSMHDRYGLFDETFTSSGDMAMWLRAVSLGSKFKKVEGYLTLFYINPEGISVQQSNSRRANLRKLEDVMLMVKYSNIWTEDPNITISASK